MKTIRILLASLLILLAMVSLAVPVCAQEVESEEAPALSAEGSAETYDAYGSWYSINWSISGTTLTISGTGHMVSLNFAYNYPWAGYGVTKIVITDSVNGIGNNAFSNMSKLTEIQFGKGLTSIGVKAFSGCTALKKVTIPSNVQELDGFTFMDCTALTDISLPSTLSYIGSGIFMGCTGLKEVTLNTDYVSSSMFQDCTGLTTVNLGKNVEYTELSAFSGCASLSKVNMTALKTLGRNTFFKCSSLKSISFPATLTTIEGSAFTNCGLTSVVIPDTVTSLGESAFINCTELTTVKFGNGLTAVPESCFSTCKKLTTVNLGGVSEISDGAFGFCSALTNITWPNKPFTIYYEAFNYCTGLTTLNFPGTLRTIDGWAFDHCSGLTSITMQNGVELVDDYAFNNCDNVVSVTCYEPNVTFGSRVFENNGSLVLRGWSGSTLESYAYTNRHTFEPITITTSDPNKIVNVVSGVHVYWPAVGGAQKYGIWRSETGKDGTYKWLGNPTVPHFTDTKVQSGKTYYYKVTVLHPVTGEHTDKSSAIGITYVSTPDITARYNKAAGIKLDWQQITGATGYAIYRKSYSGNDEWVRVATITGNSTFTWTDTSVKSENGTAYKYTIRALAGTNMKTLSGCRNAGRSMVRLASRVLTAAEKADATSIKCSWTTSSAVTGYEVRFMVGSTVYKTFTVGNYKTGVKTFTGLEKGQTYKIQVRSYRKIDGMGFYSAWSTAKEVTL